MRKISKKIVGVVEIDPRDFATFKQEVKNIADLKIELEDVLKFSATDILQVLFGSAICLDASDVHIESEERGAKIRVRVDGILQDVITLERTIYEVLISRIKLLSEIKLNISDRPQDGRFSVLIGDFSIEVRASTLPAEYGEAAVLRILNPKSLIELDSLGLRDDLLKIFEREIKQPNGMIIVTGPTGSGKTTSLYSFLKRIKNPEIKIITIEDPIEYHLEGISQTQVAPEKGYDFANGLKSIMRQDPDVILVGEIRDLETADIALQAALTGHLVFTTLHTNDAAGTIARLINLGTKPADIGPAINLVIAQRLVRKVCKNCAKFESPSFQELEKIKQELKDVPKNIKIPALDSNLKIPRAVGCRACNSTGFTGRIGIFEAFLVDDEMEKFILENPSTAALKEKSTKKGMVTIKQDGIIKTLEGITTLEEVERVTGE